MSTREIIKSRQFKIAALVAGIVLIALVSFGGGVAVGLHKAKFSYHFGENYEKNFIGPRPDGPMGMMPFPPDFEGRGFRNGHGIAGAIISISDNTVVIKDRDDKENTVAISDKTVIKSGRDTISLIDLKNGEQIVVLGKPADNGVVNADLIRVFSNDGQNQ